MGFGSSGVAKKKTSETGEIQIMSEAIQSSGLLAALKSSVSKVFFGRIEVIDQLIVGLIASGHVLVEDVPGVGKTVLARALAKSLDCRFSRIQLTPDMLPTDVIGVSVYNEQTRDFEFKRGPLFANIILAD